MGVYMYNSTTMKQKSFKGLNISMYYFFYLKILGILQGENMAPNKKAKPALAFLLNFQCSSSSISM